MPSRITCANCGLALEPTTELPGMGKWRHPATGWRSCIMAGADGAFTSGAQVFAEPEVPEPDWSES